MAYDMRWMGINKDGEGEVWFWIDSVCKVSKERIACAYSAGRAYAVTYRVHFS